MSTFRWRIDDLIEHFTATTERSWRLSMSFPNSWTLRPLGGAEQVQFGMSYDQVVGLLGEPDQPTSRVWRSEATRAGWRDGGLAIHFSPEVVFVEFSRGTGLAVSLEGVDVLGTPAVEVVQALVANGHSLDAEVPESSHMYVFKDIQVALWRQVVPEGPTDDEGRYFDTVGVGEAGYYS